MAAAPAGSAADAQARFGRSVKGLLIDRVTGCGTDVIALTKQVLKGSRSSELLGHAARNMVMQEDSILHSEDSLRKMAIITTHLQYQQEAIQKNGTGMCICLGTKTEIWRADLTWNTSFCLVPSVEHSSNLQDQLRHLLK